MAIQGTAEDKQYMSRAVAHCTKFSTIIFTLFFCANILSYFNFIPVLIDYIFLMLLGIASVVFISKWIYFSNLQSFILFLILYTFCGIVSLIYNGNADVQEMLWPIAFMSLGLLLLTFPPKFETVARLYYISVVIFLPLTLWKGLSIFETTLSSKNTVGTLQFLLFAVYCISADRHGKNPKIILAAFLGILCSSAVESRGGVVAFAAILLVSVYLNYRRKGCSVIKTMLTIFVPLTLIAIGLYLVYRFSPSVIQPMVDRFIRRGLNTPRTQTWLDYLHKITESGFHFLFGAPIEGTALLNQFSENLHNSFFMLHAKYGIVMFVIVIVKTLASLAYFLKNRCYLLIIVWLGLFIHMNLNYTNFNAGLDVIFIYLIFYADFQKRNAGNWLTLHAQSAHDGGQ